MGSLRQLGAALALSLTSTVARAATPDAKGWADDLDALLAQIEATHPNPHHTTSKAALDVQTSAYRKALPGMSEAERVAGMARLLAAIGDGHTWMPMHALPFADIAPGPGFHSLPVRFELFDDGLFIVGAHDPSVVGRRVVAIGDVPVAEAIARTMELLPRDATHFSQELAPEWLMQAELLVALGLAETPDAVRLALTDGVTTQSVGLSPLPDGAVFDWLYSMDGGPRGVDSTWYKASSDEPVWQAPFEAPTRLVPLVGGGAQGDRI
jgi:hypothetical protein